MEQNLTRAPTDSPDPPESESLRIWGDRLPRMDWAFNACAVGVPDMSNHPPVISKAVATSYASAHARVPRLLRDRTLVPSHHAISIVCSAC